MQALKILIIEDEVIPAFRLTTILNNLGYVVTSVASDYDSALLAFEKDTPDLVLIDIDLGKDSKNGIEIAHNINIIGSDIPIVFISGKFEKEDQARVNETNYADYIAKPYNKYQIELTVARVLRNKTLSPGTDKILTGKNHAFVKEKQNMIRIDYDDIYALSASGKLSFIHTKNKKRLISTPLNKLLEQFHFPDFLRIHRSHAIHLQKVIEVNFYEGQLTVSSGEKHFKFDIGPNYKEELAARIKMIKSL